MTDTERTGAFLAQKRKEKGLTQLELAQALSVTNRAVSKWETGAGLPDADVLPALAAALGTTADAILRGEEPRRAGESPALWAFEAADTAGELREGAAALPQTGAIGRCIAAAAALALWAASLVFLLGAGGSASVSAVCFGAALALADAWFLGVLPSAAASRILRRRTMTLAVHPDGFVLASGGARVRFGPGALRGVRRTRRCLVFDFGAQKVCVRRLSPEDETAFLRRLAPDVPVRDVSGRAKRAAAAVVCAALLVFGTAVLTRAAGVSISVSPSGKVLVLRVAPGSGEGAWYRGVRRYPLAWPVDTGEPVRCEWLTGDACAVTYTSREDRLLHQSVATFGTRGSGISWYDVRSALAADWASDDGETRLWQDGGAFCIQYAGRVYRFDMADCVPFGDLAVVACSDGVPQFTAVLGEDFVFAGEDSGGAGGGGSIVLCPVTDEAGMAVTLYDKEVAAP